MDTDTFGFKPSSNFFKQVAKIKTINQLTNDESKKIEMIWDILNQTDGCKKMPERFMAIILTFSQSKEPIEAMKEWTNIQNIQNENEKEPQKLFCEIKQCICSQNIEITYRVKNKLNNNILVIGSSCIEKFGCKELKDLHKAIKKRDNYGGDKMMCAGCCNHRIAADESWKTYCTKCFDSGIRKPSDVYKILNQYKECSMCKKQEILPSSQKIICYNCSLINAKECSLCKEKRLPLDSPIWDKICRECIEEGMKNPRECSICKLKRISSNDATWKTTCSFCIEEGNANPRQCSRCELKKIPSYKPIDIKLCVDCKKEEDANNSRECQKCGLKNIPNSYDLWKTYCIGCIKEGNENPRECEGCGEKKIPSYKPDTIELCAECTKEDKKMMMEYARACEKCGQKKILPTSEDYIKLCMDCNMENKKEKEELASKNCRNCEICKLKNVPSDWPDWRKSCVSCFVKSKGSGYTPKTTSNFSASNQKRECTICKLKNINPTSNFKVCYTCNQKNKK